MIRICGNNPLKTKKCETCGCLFDHSYDPVEEKKFRIVHESYGQPWHWLVKELDELIECVINEQRKKS